jgi:hypothetical protein
MLPFSYLECRHYLDSRQECYLTFSECVQLTCGKNIKFVQSLIEKHNPQAFYSIEDIRAANLGVFPQGADQGKVDYFKRIFPYGGGR